MIDGPALHQRRGRAARADRRTLGIDDRDGRHDGQVPTYKETLPGGVEHTIIEIEGDRGFNDNTELFVVPPDHYFMMGDNRDNSTDSRVPPRSGRRRLRAGRESRRPRRSASSSRRRQGRRAGLAILALALDGAAGAGSSRLRIERRCRDDRRRSAMSPRSRRARPCFRRPDSAGAGADPCQRRNGGDRAILQRLEFLGDRVLGLVVAEMLYEAFLGPRARGAVAPARRARAQGDLRRGRARVGRRAIHSSSAKAKRRAADATRRRFSATSARRSSAPCSSTPAAAAARRSCGALSSRAWSPRAAGCAIPRPCCRNGRRARKLPAPPIPARRPQRPRPRAALRDPRRRSMVSRRRPARAPRSARPSRRRRSPFCSARASRRKARSRT